jgi:hypothetical protein
MARVTEEEIGIARRMAAEAKTLHQLRQSQAILLPALTGATFDTAYAALGLQEGAGGGIALDGGRQDEYRRDELLSATGWPSPSGSACSDGARRGHLAQGESPGQTGQRFSASFAALFARIQPAEILWHEFREKSLRQSSVRFACGSGSRGRTRPCQI